MYTNLSELPTSYVQCRTFGHVWEEFIPVGKRKPQHGFRFSLLCVSCGSERHDLLNLSGELLSREYAYADNYQVNFKASRDDYRVELNRRKRKRVRRGSQVVELKAV